MAPPNRSIFSVSVVLPASGCEIIAKVRRRATGLGSGMGFGLWEERLSHSVDRAVAEGRLFPTGSPAFASITFRQSELRPDVGEGGHEPLLDLERISLAGEFRLRGALKG